MTEEAVSLMTVDQGREAVRSLSFGEVQKDATDLRLSVSQQGELRLTLEDFGPLAFTQEAETELRQMTHMDKRFLQEFVDDRDLQERVVGHILGRFSGRPLRIVHTPRAVVGVKPADESYVSPMDLYNLVAENSQLHQVRSVQFTPRGLFEMRMLLEQHFEPARKVGDISHAGLRVKMNGRPEVAAYIYTLRCTNGMIGEDSYPAQVETGRPIQMHEAVARLVQEQVQLANALCQRLVQSDETTVANPQVTLIRLARERGVGDRLTRRLIERIPSLEEPVSQYDLTSLITSEANGLGFQDRERLQRFGHAVTMAVPDARCSHCGSTLR